MLTQPVPMGIIATLHRLILVAQTLLMIHCDNQRQRYLYGVVFSRLALGQWFSVQPGAQLFQRGQFGSPGHGWAGSGGGWRDGHRPLF